MENCQGLDDRFQVSAETSFEAEEKKGKRQKSKVWNYVYLYIYVPSTSAGIKKIKC
jgi:hypothetical protein